MIKIFRKRNSLSKRVISAILGIILVTAMCFVVDPIGVKAAQTHTVRWEIPYVGDLSVNAIKGDTVELFFIAPDEFLIPEIDSGITYCDYDIDQQTGESAVIYYSNNPPSHYFEYDDDNPEVHQVSINFTYGTERYGGGFDEVHYSPSYNITLTINWSDPASLQPGGGTNKTVSSQNEDNKDPDNNDNSTQPPAEPEDEFGKAVDAANDQLENAFRLIQAYIRDGKTKEIEELRKTGITIDTDILTCFGRSTYELIYKLTKEGIPVKINFIYNKTKYTTTIPAYTALDPSSLCDKTGFCGFLNIKHFYGGTER
ncbi:MAG: hypothetical protein K5921_06840 [Lachnospiraceae bacterium]|nr:hypothetical protein [Lachnospiraceae bacterium]